MTNIPSNFTILEALPYLNLPRFWSDKIEEVLEENERLKQELEQAGDNLFNLQEEHEKELEYLESLR